MASTRNARSEQILRAAMHLFHERGFDGVGVDLIGERAGMSGPGIYRYFSGKDEILLTLLDEAADRLLMATAGQFDDPRDELEHLVEGHVKSALEERELMSVWMRERNSIPKQSRSRLSARVHRYVRRWADCLAANYPDQDEDTLLVAVHTAHGLIDSVAFWPAQALKVEGADQVLTVMALAGLDSLGNGAMQPRKGSERTANDRSA